MPKKSCGQYVNLFIKGYVNASGIEASAIIIVKKLKLIRTKKANWLYAFILALRVGAYNSL